MDYEKKYKEALTRAESFYRNGKGCTKSMVYTIFPELAESEDERIRKAIIEIVKKDEERIGVNAHLKKIQWLEKQGEQKPAETVKWSQQEESCICQLESLVKEQWRQAEIVHNSEKIKRMSELMFFLKTLNPNKKPDYCHHEVDLSDRSEEYCKAYYDGWNNCNQQHSQLRAMQKPWSEEDSPYYDDICEILINLIHSKTADVNKDVVQKDLDWFVSIKDRVQPQPKQEWSSGDEAHLHSLITHLEQWIERHPNTTGADIQGENIAWLKSLVPQSHWKPSDEQMEALEHFVRSIGESGYASPYDNNTKLLYSLLSDLKKLK